MSGPYTIEGVHNARGVARMLRITVAKAERLVRQIDGHTTAGRHAYVSHSIFDSWVEAKLIKNVSKPVAPSVYFVASADLSLVKIGKTTSNLEQVNNRVVDLQRSSPYQLFLVASVVGYTLVENWMHRRFGEHRRHGEWFSANADLDDLILRAQEEGPSLSLRLCGGLVNMDLRTKGFPLDERARVP